VNPDVGAAGQALVGKPPIRKTHRPLGVGTLCRHSFRSCGFQQQGRGGYGSAKSTEAAAQLSSQIQHAEVKPRGRFDENAIASGHTA
jgi:hypothetical protein